MTAVVEALSVYDAKRKVLEDVTCPVPIREVDTDKWTVTTLVSGRIVYRQRTTAEKNADLGTNENSPQRSLPSFVSMTAGL